MSRLLNPMSQTFTTEPMHSLPSQTAPGHNSLYKTFPTYAFLWNIHLYHEYIFLFCPFFLIGFGPFLVLILVFWSFFSLYSVWLSDFEEEYTPLNEFCTWLSYLDRSADRGWSEVLAAVSNI